MIWAQVMLCVALWAIGMYLRKPPSMGASRGHRYKARQFSRRRSHELVKVRTGLFSSHYVMTGSSDE